MFLEIIYLLDPRILIHLDNHLVTQIIRIINYSI